MLAPIFDAHFHIIDPRFPLVENRGFVPDRYTCEDYLRDAAPLGIVGGAVVSGSFQAFDQTYLLDALARLGPAFVGVTQLAPEVSDAEIARLHAAGVRAVRFNVFRGGSAAIDALEALAARVFAVAGGTSSSTSTVEGSPSSDLGCSACRGWLSITSALSASGLPSLLELVERGSSVKASGFGRVDFPVVETLRRIATANPDALVFGTDSPSTRAPVPFRPSDVDLVADALGDDIAKKVLLHNGWSLYRPAAHP